MSEKQNLFNDDDGSPDKGDKPEVVDSKETNTVGGNEVSVDNAKTGIVKPVGNINEVVEMYEKFSEIKTKLLKDSDMVTIEGDPSITKSGWRKIATAFNVSVGTREVHREVDNGVLRYSVEAHAEAPNGRESSGWSIAESTESNFMKKLKNPSQSEKDSDTVFKVSGSWRKKLPPEQVSDHDVMTLAETRAKNRAISDLVGGGEVSAEERKKVILSE